MITTVTLNPCIDRTITIESFRYGGTNKVTKVRKDISGKGINVSKALKNLGLDTLCLGFNYEKGASELRQTLDELDIRHDFVETPGEIRTNIKLFDASKKIMSEFNESGHPVQAESLEKFLKKIKFYLLKTDILILDGSVPKGVPSDIYRKLIELANVKGIRTILDAAGELFLKGIEGKPYLVKPNIDELSQALNREFHSRDEIVEAAREIVGKGVRFVCVSLGAEGAILVNEKEALFAPALELDVRGVQGAGDSLVAGFCLAMKKEPKVTAVCPGMETESTVSCQVQEKVPEMTACCRTMEENSGMAAMLRCAMACAAGSLVKEGTELCDREAFERFFPQVRVEKIE